MQLSVPGPLDINYRRVSMITKAEVASLGKQNQIDPDIEERISRIGAGLRWTGVIYALIVLAGVPLDRNLFRPAETSAISPVAAVVLAVLAVGALLAGGTTRSSSGAVPGRTGLTLCLVAAAVGGLLIVDTLGGPTLVSVGEGRPTFGLGLGVFALGVAAPLSTGRLEWQVLAGQVTALGVSSLGLVIVLGHFYDEPLVTRLFGQSSISFHGSILTLILAGGILLFRPGSGLVSAASSPGPGGTLLRRLGPFVLLIPPVLLLLSEAVPVDRRVDVIISVSVLLGVLFVVIFSLAVQVIDQGVVEASASAAQADRAAIGLEQEAPLVASLEKVLHIVEIDEIEGWEVATRFRQATGAMAGDTSGVEATEGGLISAVLVDVTGHGVDPALKAIRIRDHLMQSLGYGLSPAEALHLVGNQKSGDELASAVVVKIDSASGRAQLASAGHPPGIFVGQQETALVGPTGPLLYLSDTSSYADEEIELGVGEALVLFSDGVADVQRSRSGRPEPEFLADMLLAEGGDAVRSAHLVIGFGEGEPADDQSVVVIRRTSSNGSGLNRSTLH